MEINISNETLQTTLSALRCAKTELKRQVTMYKGWRKANAEEQLENVHDALAVFEEMDERYNG